MSFWIAFGIHTLAMLFVWGFFMIAKLHVHKFRNYSVHLAGVLRFMTAFLLIVTILGYVLVFRMDAPIMKTESVSKKSVEEVY